MGFLERLLTKKTTKSVCIFSYDSAFAPVSGIAFRQSELAVVLFRTIYTQAEILSFSCSHIARANQNHEPCIEQSLPEDHRSFLLLPLQDRP